MRLFVAVAAVLAVADAARSQRGNGANGLGGQSSSKKVRRGGLYVTGGPQQSLQGIIDGLTASSGGGISHGHGASSYAYVSGVGSPVSLVSPAPVVGYLAHPQPAASYAPVSYGPPAVSAAAYAPHEHSAQVAYAPQVAAYAPPVVAASPEYGVPQGAPLGGGGDAAAQISKSVYVFSAPHDPSDRVRPQVYKSFPHKKQKHYQVVFINAPNPPLPAQHTVELPAPPELKTQIYVLVKKPQKAPPIKVIPAKVPVNKPEVFFIRYKNNGQGGPIQDSGPLVAGPHGHPEQYGPPTSQVEEGGYPGEPVAIQEEYGAPGGHGGHVEVQEEYGGPGGPGEVSDYSGGSHYAQGEPEGHYGGPAGHSGEPESHYGPPGHSGGGHGHEEYVVSSPEGGEYGAGPPYESSGHSGHGGDTYGEYSKHVKTVSTRPLLRRRRPTSIFRMSSRSDNTENWKPMIPSHKQRMEGNAGMSGI